MLNNLPPDVTLDSIPCVNAPDGNQIADDLACWFQKACELEQKANNRFPHVDVVEHEYRGGLVNLEIHLTGIDPERKRALAHRILNLGRMLLEMS